MAVILPAMVTVTVVWTVWATTAGQPVQNNAAKNGKNRRFITVELSKIYPFLEQGKIGFLRLLSGLWYELLIDDENILRVPEPDEKNPYRCGDTEEQILVIALNDELNCAGTKR